jgi:hypothetical protein
VSSRFRGSQLLHFGAMLAAYLGAFIATCTVIARVLPFPNVPVVRTKIDYLAAHRHAFDTLFLGSSRVYFQIIPSLFDEATARGGRPTRSFNAGVSALRPPEDAFFLEKILARPPTQWRYVFVEVTAVRTRPENLESVRAVYWHDWPRLCVLWRSMIVQLSTQSRNVRFSVLRETLPDFSEHLSLFIRNVTNQGRGAILTDRFFQREAPASAATELGDKMDGWVPVGQRQTMPQAEKVAYEQRLAERLRDPSRPTFADEVSQAELERMIVQIERCGAVPILIVPPTPVKRKFYPDPGRMHSAILLDFADVARFPQLFAADQRLDATHLNTRGSQTFTQLLAERFLEETARR